MTSTASWFRLMILRRSPTPYRRSIPMLVGSPGWQMLLAERPRHCHRRDSGARFSGHTWTLANLRRIWCPIDIDRGPSGARSAMTAPFTPGQPATHVVVVHYRSGGMLGDL